MKSFLLIIASVLASSLFQSTVAEPSSLRGGLNAPELNARGLNAPPANCKSWILIQNGQDNSCSALASACGIDLPTLFTNNGNLQGGNACNVLAVGEFVCCRYV